MARLHIFYNVGDDVDVCVLFAVFWSEMGNAFR